MYNFNSAQGDTFKYETGTTYKYKLEGITHTKLSGSQNNASKLEISAYADISALPNCVYSLKLSDVQLVGQDGKVNFVCLTWSYCHNVKQTTEL
jgi:hypothetical protein